MRIAMFGKQVEHFLKSDIGGYLVNRANAESEAALKELRDVDPFDGPKVSAVQMKVKVAESIIIWLGDAIAAGEQATEQLKQEQED